ncbi:hypothetical protein D1872_295820 [compost metagenome]
MWKKASEFEIGQRVSHSSHGAGTVYAYDNSSDDDILVEFDVQPSGWDKILCVTANNLVKLSS